ncbi:DUF397 domain-containing protein [Streptomyces sp. NPDC048415]|uniref:DUF397 domain-containing protein n=1 Tax=Streptomyces sp. NPDC048415 TaxID=3154822 RepID=UPI003428FB39
MRSSEQHVSIPDASVVPMWRKSSYSGGESGQCLEVSDAYVTAAWRKSTYSGGDSGECLEVNDSCPVCVPVRDSKNPHGPALVFTAVAWTSFVTEIKTIAL